MPGRMWRGKPAEPSAGELDPWRDQIGHLTVTFKRTSLRVRTYKVLAIRAE